MLSNSGCNEKYHLVCIICMYNQSSILPLIVEVLLAICSDSSNAFFYWSLPFQLHHLNFYWSSSFSSSKFYLIFSYQFTFLHALQMSSLTQFFQEYILVLLLSSLTSKLYILILNTKWFLQSLFSIFQFIRYCCLYSFVHIFVLFSVSLYYCSQIFEFTHLPTAVLLTYFCFIRMTFFIFHSSALKSFSWLLLPT